MKLMKLCALLAVLAIPFATGCADSTAEPAVDGNDIAAYVSENPNSDAGTEVEGGTE